MGLAGPSGRSGETSKDRFAAFAEMPVGFEWSAFCVHAERHWAVIGMLARSAWMLGAFRRKGCSVPRKVRVVPEMREKWQMEVDRESATR